MAFQNMEIFLHMNKGKKIHRKIKTDTITTQTYYTHNRKIETKYHFTPIKVIKYNLKILKYSLLIRPHENHLLYILLVKKKKKKHSKLKANIPDKYRCKNSQ